MFQWNEKLLIDVCINKSLPQLDWDGQVANDRIYGAGTVSSG